MIVVVGILLILSFTLITKARGVEMEGSDKMKHI